MSRRVLGAAMAAAWICSGAASAQVARGSATPSGITFNRPPDPPPQTQPRPTPEAPGRHHGRGDAPPAGGDLFLADPDTYAPRYDRRINPRRLLVPHPYGYFTKGYLAAPVVTVAPRRYPVERQTPAAGFLRLRLQPRTAQVHVDGVFVGAVEDFRGSQYALGPGAHRVEISADGFETRSFEVRIRAGGTVTFTSDLRRTQEPVVESAPATPVTTVVQQPAAKTIYVIPRCYAGDRPPVASQLPEGCSVSAVRVIPPATP